jgi:hypothetical protein
MIAGASAAEGDAARWTALEFRGDRAADAQAARKEIANATVRLRQAKSSQFLSATPQLSIPISM